MRHLLVVEHELDTPAGLLEDWAAARGLTVTTVRPGRGEPLPRDLSWCTGVVVLGSEQTAFDDSLPWLQDELSLVERALMRSVPLLGICFGGQALARVLGARLYRLSRPEIGWVRISSPYPGLAEGPWLAWHRDGFELPQGARELATGGVSVQAFAIGPHVGVQFHPEATQPIMESWLAGTDPPLAAALAARLRAGWEEATARTAADAPALFSAWLDGNLRPGDSGPAAASASGAPRRAPSPLG